MEWIKGVGTSGFEGYLELRDENSHLSYAHLAHVPAALHAWFRGQAEFCLPRTQGACGLRYRTPSEWVRRSCRRLCTAPCTPTYAGTDHDTQRFSSTGTTVSREQTMHLFHANPPNSFHSPRQFLEGRYSERIAPPFCGVLQMFFPEEAVTLRSAACLRRCTSI